MQDDKIINYIIRQSIFGYILIARSKKGICAIFIGNDISLLVSNLQNIFSKILFDQKDQDLQKDANQIMDFIKNPKMKLNVPLDINGTEFQKKVWKILEEIPLGKTISYKILAQRIGLPSAIRAVANACAANLLSIVIPCHRVIKNNGRISGYRWGKSLKQELLRYETNPQ